MNLETLVFQTPYLKLDDEFYSFTDIEPLKEAYLIHANPNTAQLVNIPINTHDNSSFTAFLNGQNLPKTIKPYSMCYAGHQFGHYAPRLGDGRVANLGTLKGWALQLKGAGETLYSRMADGRTSLPSSIREYLMSEAMYHLDIPTSRVLGIIGSQTTIVRDRIEKAAMVMRMAPSWIRFGSFEYFYYTKEYAKLEQLAEYVITESYPHLKGEEDRFYTLFSEITERTATLVAKWQAIGFVHGVMNSDNMSISGLGIDYGPFGMLDDFNFNHVANKKDSIGRYSYGAQPNIAYWNLSMLAKAFSPLVEQKRLQEILDNYGNHLYPSTYLELMRHKLGLTQNRQEDQTLIEELIGALQDAYVDYTLFFRTLSHYNGGREALYDIAMNPIAIHNWLELYDKRLLEEKSTHAERQKNMLSINPKYVLKNYMLEQAIAHAEKGDFNMLETLFYIAQHPYDELPEYAHFAEETAEESKNIQLSCSS